MALSLGPDWQRGLWASEYRLRFDLNQGGPPVNMFTKSYDRARTLARAALPGDEVVGVVGAYPDPTRELGAGQRGWTTGTSLDCLRRMGVPTEAPIATWTGPWWPEGEAGEKAEPWAQLALGLTWDQADILLWNQIAHDIGVSPQAPVMSKFVDLTRGVSVNAYDDRGMDITALDAHRISELYIRFDAWLLDFDRPRMSALFQPAFPR